MARLAKQIRESSFTNHLVEMNCFDSRQRRFRALLVGPLIWCHKLYLRALLFSLIGTAGS